MRILIATFFLAFSLGLSVEAYSQNAPTPPTPPKSDAAKGTATAGSTPTTTTTAATATSAPSATQPASVKPLIEDKLVLIATGSVTGVYYPAGGAICRLVNKDRKIYGVRCTTESTPGSIYNIDALKNADVEFGIVQSDWQEHSYNGTGLFASKGKFDKLRFVFSLYNEAMTIVVAKNSKIAKLDDIKGKIINIGPEGSGARATFDDLMKAKGWTKADFRSVSELKPNDQARALCSGTVDALIVATGHPNGLVQEVTSMCETKIVPVNDDVVQRFISGNPELSTVAVPGGLYAGIPDDVPTFGVKATLVTTSDVSDDVVYNVTKAVFGNLEAFKGLHPVFHDLVAAKMAMEGKIAPYHPGALKYYKEKGLVGADVTQ